MAHGYQTSDARKRAEAAGPDHYVYDDGGTLTLGSFCACGPRSGVLTGTGRLRCADCWRVIRGLAT